MNEGNSKIPQIVLFVVIIVITILAFKFIIFNDFSNKDEADNNTSKYNDEPALTLKSDKEAQAKLKEKQAQEDKDKDKKDDKKDKDKKDDKKASLDKMRKDAEDKAVKTLEIQSKPKDQFKEKSTQTLFSNVATKDYVKSHKGSTNKGDKTIKYKNAKIDISDKELEKSNPKGTLKFDRLVNPKDKSSKVKPSTEVDSKVSVTFKKEGNTLKVDGTQT